MKRRSYKVFDVKALEKATQEPSLLGEPSTRNALRWRLPCVKGMQLGGISLFSMIVVLSTASAFSVLDKDSAQLERFAQYSMFANLLLGFFTSIECVKVLGLDSSFAWPRFSREVRRIPLVIGLPLNVLSFALPSVLGHQPAMLMGRIFLLSFGSFMLPSCIAAVFRSGSLLGALVPVCFILPSLPRHGLSFTSPRWPSWDAGMVPALYWLASRGASWHRSLASGQGFKRLVYAVKDLADGRVIPPHLPARYFIFTRLPKMDKWPPHLQLLMFRLHDLLTQLVNRFPTLLLANLIIIVLVAKGQMEGIALHETFSSYIWVVAYAFTLVRVSPYTIYLPFSRLTRRWVDLIWIPSCTVTVFLVITTWAFLGWGLATVTHGVAQSPSALFHDLAINVLPVLAVTAPFALRQKKFKPRGWHIVVLAGACSFRFLPRLTQLTVSSLALVAFVWGCWYYWETQDVSLA